MAGALGLLLAAAMGAVPPAHMRPRLDVAVVVEPDVTLIDADLNAIADGVRTLWRPAADVRLRRSSSIGVVASSDTIQLVLTRRVRRASGPALGWVDFVEGAPKPVITVSIAEIAALMDAGHWHGRALNMLPAAVRQQFTRRALTFAAAHEIGHYLLRSTGHSRHGLMQPNFAVDDIMDSSPSIARLSADEVSRVGDQASLAARQGY
jgi:hypothetical protein